MPKLISSDNGNEFLGPVATLLTRLKIAHSFKAVGDVNAIGLIDRAIMTLTKKTSRARGQAGQTLERTPGSSCAGPE